MGRLEASGAWFAECRSRQAALSLPTEPFSLHCAIPWATRAALRLANRNDLSNEVIANRIIDLAKTGVLDPEALCEGALKSREQ
jgi:hypothetical protein